MVYSWDNPTLKMEDDWGYPCSEVTETIRHLWQFQFWDDVEPCPKRTVIVDEVTIKNIFRLHDQSSFLAYWVVYVV